jgi:glycosyltransferase involved in cell wall biosynthesis
MTLAGTDESGGIAPEVSVIIPARNEEASIGRCLESLVSQTGIAFEIIVVNDHSTDRTREIAESFLVPHICPILADVGLPVHVMKVTVVDAGPLPQGWYGKSNACVTGATLARGKWLLFTDADTVHKPGSLARAVAEAKTHGADLLSYSPEQEVRGIAERALMPVIFAELASTYKPKDVCDPASPVAAANGQYLLITREAYDAVGGHAAVAGDLLEDVALARLVKQSGRRLRFRFGGDAVRTRMYRTFAQMREGWTKNLALLFASPGKLAALRSLEFIASVGGFAVVVFALVAGRVLPHVSFANVGHRHDLALAAAIIAAPT